MNYLNLTGRICREFELSNSQQMRTVQKVKENLSRDVVTELDEKLHAITEKFVAEQIPECKLLSEEGVPVGFITQRLLEDDFLIVDPLDGSHNYALGLPNYGFMAAHVQRGHINGAVIVVPEHGQYIVLQGDKCLCAQPLVSGGARDNGTVYYAYPPVQNTLERQARGALQDLIDVQSAGMYRYGSACIGLYQLLSKKHVAFIGHGIRLWDAIAFLPVLALQEIEVRYQIKGLSITLLASKRSDFLESAAQVLKEKQGITLHKYLREDALRVETP
jgi:fructose-1,6-bisphosphatase/inositol monophosphatase family enzyme